jgi:Gpi18-like mannosyltransferase
MSNKIKTLLAILALTVIPTLLVWLPFYIRLNDVAGVPIPQEGMATVVANYDGPLFIVVAKSFYDTNLIEQFPFTLRNEYYAAHFPLYPAFVRLFSTFLNYPYALLVVTLLSSALAIYFFQKLIRNYVDEDQVWWATLAFSIFPARWLIVRSVGSAEPLFIAVVIASVHYYKEKRYFLAGLYGAAAVLTKSPGILLFVAFALHILLSQFRDIAILRKAVWFKKLEVRKYLPLLLIPASLLGLFYLYHIRYADFFAYFNSGDNIHLFFPPFQIFNYSQSWVGTFWLEEIIFVYLFCIMGLLQLIKQKQYEIVAFVAVFFVSIIFVSHRDVIRYALPIVPFLFVAYAKFITTKEFKIALVFLAVPIYLFSIAYISNNVMPIPDWRTLL